MDYILQGVDSLRVVYYAEFTVGSDCYLRGVDHENLNDSPDLKRDNHDKINL